MDATLMILQLLLSFESLLTFGSRTLELVFALNADAVISYMTCAIKGRVADLGGLNEPLGATFVSKVGAAHLSLT